MSDERCETCRFWQRYTHADAVAYLGSCRRYPPAVENFPQTYEDTWCGEWSGSVNKTIYQSPGWDTAQS